METSRVVPLVKQISIRPEDSKRILRKVNLYVYWYIALQSLIQKDLFRAMQTQPKKRLKPKEVKLQRWSVRLGIRHRTTTLLEITVGRAAPSTITSNFLFENEISKMRVDQRLVEIFF